jgi:class 3 adenylate cyclase/pimeloyl-ACP methyl ester carboxylesterase
LTSPTPVTEPLQLESPRAYTPPHLAEKILTSRSALQGERKHVTVLFVDVSGFTALSERLDPEDVHQLMDRAFELMLAEIHLYEGTVNQFLGDGLMALFGAPIAHEDHAVRAVHAALGIQRALRGYRDEQCSRRGIEFQVRVGLNAGPVVVGKIGDNLRMDYTAVGDTTNLAARLVALAEPGRILISEEIVRAVGPYFVVHPLGEVTVKGKTAPIRAYQVEVARSVRGRIEAVSETGLTPLVGRDRELALLQERFAEVQEGRGQVLLVFGEAGIGKSRLIAEFRRHAETSMGSRWLVGRCVSYGQAISYLPVLDVVRELFGLADADPADEVRAKIDTGLNAMGGDLPRTAPFLRALLSLDPGDPSVTTMVPAQRHGRTTEAIRALVAHQSERGPVVVLLEDLHWIDPASQDVVRLLVEAVAALPVLVMLTYRPGYAPPFGDQTYFTRITLHGLPPGLVGAMVEGVLGGTHVPPGVRELIARRADGNPLFVEELGKTLVEDGTLERENGGYRLARPITESAIPETIQGVIMARIDRLPEASKSALQVASVIGREFSARLVERVAIMEHEAPRALGELRAVELIYEKSIYPELAYMFKHALTHDVAYQSLLRQRRREIHRRVGEVVEELYPDRLSEFYETLAWHFSQGEAWTKAADYLLKAATKARAQFAFPEAARFAAQAVEILGRHGGGADARVTAAELLGDIRSLLGELDSANVAYEAAARDTRDEGVRRRLAGKRHREGFAVREGARIAYYEHGTRGPTLLLMHPMLYGIETFQPMIELLGEEFRIVTFDPRGTGKSEALRGAYYSRDYVADAMTILDATGSDRVVCIGNSRGGRDAITFASTYPDRVSSLVVVDATPAATTAPDYPVPFDTSWRLPFIQSVRTGDYGSAIRLFAERVFAEPGAGKLVELVMTSWTRLPRATLDNFFTLNDPGLDVRPLLPGLRVPTLVMHGERDLLTPLEAGQWIAGQIPGAEFYLFKDRCHSPQWTAPFEFARVVRNFILTGRTT